LANRIAPTQPTSGIRIAAVPANTVPFRNVATAKTTFAATTTKNVNRPTWAQRLVEPEGLGDPETERTRSSPPGSRRVDDVVEVHAADAADAPAPPAACAREARISPRQREGDDEPEQRQGQELRKRFMPRAPRRR
jgi:hypothetical protein